MKTRLALSAALFGAVSALVLGASAQGAPTGLLAEPGAVVQTAPAATPVSFEVFLPLRNETGLDALIKAQQTLGSASYHKWLTPASFAAQYGPTPAQMQQARTVLTAAGFTVTASHSRSMTVAGSVATVNRAFGVALKSVTSKTGDTALVSATALQLPAALQAQGATVSAFANLPRLQTQHAVVTTNAPDNRNSNVGGYYFTDLREAYDYPALNTTMSNGQLLNGAGVHVAIVMSSPALNSDVNLAFQHEHWTSVTGKPAPTFTVLNVDGGCPSVNSCSAFDEASLDTQEVLGGAPGANVTLVNIPTLGDNYITDAYLYIDEANTYDIVSSSFGGCELNYTAAYNGGVDYTSVFRTYDGLFKQGNAQGITWIASSGDQGGVACPAASYFSGKPASFIPSVEFPSNDPNVTGVGGGNLVTTTPPSPQTNPITTTSDYVAENANGDPEIPYDPYGVGVLVTGGYWGAGGGPSSVFAAPSYQSLVTTGSTARTVPDIGMHVGGCPAGLSQLPCGPLRSYVIIYIGGERYGLIGTSIAAPEFAGAAALYVQRKGRQGNLNTFLYTQSAAQNANSALGYFNRNIPGFDGKWSNTFPAGGYDYLVGNGTPRVRYLFNFTDLPAAGDPWTASNP